MNHLSLFSGIGGFDAAAEIMGWNNIGHCEWNEFGRVVLKHYWPNAKSYNDITKTDFTELRGHVEVLSGGFPCQPYSAAGKRLGKEDDRHLWPEMLRAIRETSPRWVVGENVLGIVSWNGGLVFDEVQTDLEAEGYSVQPYVLPAAGVGAPHQRYRVWFVAYRESTGVKKEAHQRGEPKFNNGSEVWDRSGANGRGWPTPHPNGLGNPPSQPSEEAEGTRSQGSQGEKGGRSRGERIDRLFGFQGDAPNTEDNGLSSESRGGESRCKRWVLSSEQQSRSELERGCKAVTNTTSGGGGENHGKGESGQFNEESERSNWQNFPTQSPICGGDDGLPTELDGITFSKWRNESTKAYGNAVVPQVVLQIFKSIEAYELL